jgi:hypothetical protein
MAVSKSSLTKAEHRSMPVKKHGIIIETPTEAPQADPSRSVLLVLAVIVSFAVLMMPAIWFLFVRT